MAKFVWMAKNITDESEMVKNEIGRLGAQHFYKEITEQNQEEFAECVIDVLKQHFPSQMTPETTQAWDSFFKVMITRMNPQNQREEK